MINLRGLFIISLLFAVPGCVRNSGLLVKSDNCSAPGMTWMEVTEGYDKKTESELAAKFEAAAKTDAERIKAHNEDSAGVSLTASYEQIAKSASGLCNQPFTN